MKKGNETKGQKIMSLIYFAGHSEVSSSVLSEDPRVRRNSGTIDPLLSRQLNFTHKILQRGQFVKIQGLCLHRKEPKIYIFIFFWNCELIFSISEKRRFPKSSSDGRGHIVPLFFSSSRECAERVCRTDTEDGVGMS